MSLLEVLLFLLYFIEIIGFFLIGLLVILRKKTTLYKAFATFAFLVGTWQLLQFIAQLVSGNHNLAVAFLQASIVISGPMVASFLIFTLLYTERRPYYILYYALGIIVGGATLFSNSIKAVRISYTGIEVPVLDFWYGVLLVFGAACILYGVYSTVLHIKQAADKVQRRQGRTLLLIMLLVGSVILLSSFYTSDFSRSNIAQHLVPTACLLGMVSYLYAIYQGLFDIHFFIARAVAYLTTLFLVTAFFVIPFAAALVYASGFNGNIETLSLVVIGVVVAIYFLQYLRNIFDKLTGKWFFRQFYNPQDVLDRLNGMLVQTIDDIDKLRNDCAQVISEALKSSSLKFVLYKSGRKQKLLDTLAKLPYEKSSTLITDELGDQRINAEQLNNERVAVVVRLRTAHEDLGFMMLGHKRSGEAYSKRDIRLLNTVAGEIALGIQNALRFEEIRSFNRTLQEKVDNATTQLRRTNAKLQELDEAKDEFVSMASHQLRTPLTSVKGYLSMALEGDAGELKPAQKKLLEEAYASSQRMVYLIGDFLNISRIKTGKFLLEYTKSNLANVIDDEIGQLRATAEARNINLVYQAPKSFPTIRLDENKVRQVIMNMIDNSIYYSRPGGIITVELYTKDEKVVFRVKDEGIGVPAREQKDLFEKFYRASNARKVRPDGTGIGLFMIKKVVLAHGGSIIFSSTENQGSTFGFMLPMKKSE